MQILEVLERNLDETPQTFATNPEHPTNDSEDVMG